MPDDNVPIKQDEFILDISCTTLYLWSSILCCTQFCTGYLKFLLRGYSVKCYYQDKIKFLKI